MTFSVLECQIQLNRFELPVGSEAKQISIYDIDMCDVT